MTNDGNLSSVYQDWFIILKKKATKHWKLRFLLHDHATLSEIQFIKIC